MVAKVAINEFTRSFATTTPLNRPTPAPASTPAATPRATLRDAVMLRDATTPENATIDATDRSTSPKAKTSIMVTEMPPIRLTDSKSPCRFRVLKKFGTLTLRITNNAANTNTMPERLNRSSNLADELPPRKNDDGRFDGDFTGEACKGARLLEGSTIIGAGPCG